MVITGPNNTGTGASAIEWTTTATSGDGITINAGDITIDATDVQTAIHTIGNATPVDWTTVHSGNWVDNTLYSFFDSSNNRTYTLSGYDRSRFMLANKRIKKNLKRTSALKGPLVDPSSIMIPHGHRKGLMLDQITFKDLNKIVEQTRHPISYSALDMLKYRKVNNSFRRLADDFSVMYSRTFNGIRKFAPYKNMLQEIEKRFTLLRNDYEREGWITPSAMRRIISTIETCDPETAEREELQDFFV